MTTPGRCIALTILGVPALGSAAAFGGLAVHAMHPLLFKEYRFLAILGAHWIPIAWISFCIWVIWFVVFFSTRTCRSREGTSTG